VVLVAVCVLVIGIYCWMAESGELEKAAAGSRDTYYNLLVRGFQAGQLNLMREVPPELARIPVPPDPGTKLSNDFPLHDTDWAFAHVLLDTSYYKGKLYLYYGVTPALVLFWPYAALTGHYLLERDAVVIFFSLGFLVSVGLLWDIWRRYFATVNFGMVVAGALAVGLASFIPGILRKCDMYEVAISCGYAFTMLTLALLWKAMHVGRRQGWWLAGASLAYGLALGARPNLLFGGIILLIPVVLAWQQKQRVWPLVLAAIGPVMIIGFGLMLYNDLRFDSPLEFGNRYLLNSEHQDKVSQFSPAFLWFNFRVAFLSPAHWDLYWPFVHDIAIPSFPPNYNNVEDPFGLLSNVPLVWLALAVPLAWRKWWWALSPLDGMMTALALLFGTSAFILCLRFTMCLRYELEFAAPLILLAVLGLFSLERTLIEQAKALSAMRWSCSLLLVFSVAFNLLARIEPSAQFRAIRDNNRGWNLYNKGQTDAAIREYQECLRISPDNAYAHNNLGWALYNKGKTDEAINEYEEAIRLKPDLQLGYMNLGIALSKKGQLDEAIGQFQEVLRLNPDSADAHHDLAALFSLEGQTDEAIRQYQAVLGLKPDDADAHNNLGVALRMKGRIDEAITQYQQAVQLRPDFVTASNNLTGALEAPPPEQR